MTKLAHAEVRNVPWWRRVFALARVPQIATHPVEPDFAGGRILAADWHDPPPPTSIPGPGVRRSR
jgi:hypothetical protein